MPFGINIRADGDAKPYWDLVDRVAALEPEPTIRALNYPPHITLAKYDRVGEDQLKHGLAALASCSKATLTFDRIGAFDRGFLVLWVAPRPERVLDELHARVHGAIDPALSKPAYRPGAWVAHCSIALRVAASHRAEAHRLVAAPIPPFALTFDTADCVSSPPIEILGQLPLL
jgi:2'-5' RNA ligase